MGFLIYFNCFVGEIWRKHRKILTPAFHMKVLEQFSDSFHKYGQLLIEKLKETEGEPIDIHKFVNLYAMDTICGKLTLAIQLIAYRRLLHNV